MKPVGYTFLNRHFNLLLPKLGVEVYQDENTDVELTKNYGASLRRVLPNYLRNLDTPYENMIAAIKYQGIRLHYFAAIFRKVDVEEFTEFIAGKPSAKMHRVLWFLFEWLTDSRLDIPDVKTGSYIALFDDNFYYTLRSGKRDKRTRIINNAIGTKDFCPTVRKTGEIKQLAEIDVYSTAYAEVQKLGSAVSSEAIGRSISYLYSKETKSSTEIEREKPDKQKMQRFLNALKNVGLFDLTKEKLVDLQNHIVEDSKKADGYRSCEIYVGSTIQRKGFVDEDVHYVGAKAEHVDSMMHGLLCTHDNLMYDAQMPPLIHATIISFGEVYIHPFDDGNGRIHRYLIHDVMKQREPEHEFIIPISASILKNEQRYDKVLECVSKPLMSMLDWELDSDNDNQIVIKNDIDYMYRYPDYTEHVKFVYEMMDEAISRDLIEELCLILVFDIVKKEINKIADIPNAKLDTIVSIIINGGGTVSKAKSKFVSKFLDDALLGPIQEKSRLTLLLFKEKIGVDVYEVMNRM